MRDEINFLMESKEEKRARKAAKKEEKAAKKEEKEAKKELKKSLKHTVDAEEEIEIDLKADVPLNKKQQRLLKKGKLNLDKIRAKHPVPTPANEEPAAPVRSKFAVWVGNLSFDTVKEDIIRFIESKAKIKEEDITRFNLPKKDNKIKGFCYIDFKTEEQMNKVIGLSEQNLNGRNLLIKNATSFEGRPESNLVNSSKNPPSRILFVGNLSFDTTDDLLKEHFKPCGEIVRIRMATFEDTGKCKGFAFIDFKDETGPTNALTHKEYRKLINRPLRMEFGEDRSKRAPKRRLEEGFNPERAAMIGAERPERPERNSNDFYDRSDRSTRPERPERPEKSYKQSRERPERPEKRLKSSIALASAQRASAAIVPSSGKKITFD